MEPLKIIFTFAAPVFVDSEYPIYLDALAAFGVMKDAESLGSENPWADADDLSSCLDRTEGDEWVWKASRLIFTPASGIMFQNMIRKSDPDRYFRDLGEYWTGRSADEDKPLGNIKPDTFRINTGSGQQRGYQWLSASQWMEKAEAWVVGDREGLEHYLSQLSHVGKIGRNGYGLIRSFVIEPAAESDAENWRLRALPISEPGAPGVQYEPVQTCIRAPYWKKLQRVVAKEPVI